MRCAQCENEWLEISARRTLGRWGRTSNALVKTAKWMAITGGTGVLLSLIAAALHPTSVVGFVFGVIALLLTLGLPAAGVVASLIPAARAAERARDALISTDRDRFLAERHPALLPPSPGSES